MIITSITQSPFNVLLYSTVMIIIHNNTIYIIPPPKKKLYKLWNISAHDLSITILKRHIIHHQWQTYHRPMRPMRSMTSTRSMGCQSESCEASCTSVGADALAPSWPARSVSAQPQAHGFYSIGQPSNPWAKPAKTATCPQFGSRTLGQVFLYHHHQIIHTNPKQKHIILPWWSDVSGLSGKFQSSSSKSRNQKYQKIKNDHNLINLPVRDLRPLVLFKT